MLQSSGAALARQEFDRRKLLFDAEIAARKDYEVGSALAAASADARRCERPFLAQLWC